MKSNLVWQKRTREEMERLIREYDQSGLTQREFAAQRGVKLSTLQYWLYRPVRPQSSPFVEVQPAAEPSEEPRHYRLEFPGGKALSCNGPLDLEELRELCHLLGG